MRRLTAVLAAALFLPFLAAAPAHAADVQSRCDDPGVPPLNVEAWWVGSNPTTVLSGSAWSEGSWPAIDYAVYDASVRRNDGTLVRALPSRRVDGPNEHANWPIDPNAHVPGDKGRFRVDATYHRNDGTTRTQRCVAYVGMGD